MYYCFSNLEESHKILTLEVQNSEEAYLRNFLENARAPRVAVEGYKGWHLMKQELDVKHSLIMRTSKRLRVGASTNRKLVPAAIGLYMAYGAFRITYRELDTRPQFLAVLSHPN